MRIKKHNFNYAAVCTNVNKLQRNCNFIHFLLICYFGLWPVTFELRPAVASGVTACVRACVSGEAAIAASILPRAVWCR